MELNRTLEKEKVFRYNFMNCWLLSLLNLREVFYFGVVLDAVRVSAQLDKVVLTRSTSDIVGKILVSLILGE